MNKPGTILSTENLTTGFYKKNRFRKVSVSLTVAANIQLQKGQLTCVLGVNGSGKSTLIRTLTGIQKPLEGEVNLSDKRIKDYASRKLAKKLSVVLTDPVVVKNMQVYDLVAMGRFPYTNGWGHLTKADKSKIDWAITTAEVTTLTNQPLYELSDGELQKALIARALAQDTPLMILDEPTSHLDIPNRIMIMRLLRKLARDNGKTILLSTHELDLALQMADQLWLMLGKKIITGVPEDLVLSKAFEQTFRKEGETFNRQTGSFQVHTPWRKSIRVQGDPTGVFWTKRALEREGFIVIDEGVASVSIEVKGVEAYEWVIQGKGKKMTCHTVECMIAYLNDKENLRQGTASFENNKTEK